MNWLSSLFILVVFHIFIFKGCKTFSSPLVSIHIWDSCAFLHYIAIRSSKYVKLIALKFFEFMFIKFIESSGYISIKVCSGTVWTILLTSLKKELMDLSFYLSQCMSIKMSVQISFPSILTEKGNILVVHLFPKNQQ